MSGENNYGHSRPRSRTVLSFGSSGSGGGIKYTKEELQESPKEKASKRISTKANPNVAMNEVEPVVQALMQPTMDSNLRGMQHRDMYGNVITDPDQSNPTRPRMERPLDTIRSFEAAIDGKYGRLSAQSETPGPSRPASAYFGGMNHSNHRRRSVAGMNGGPGYGGGRSGRPESYIDSSMYGSSNRKSPAPFGGNSRRGFGSGNRNNSDPMLYGNGAYGQQQPQQLRREPYQPSYESGGSSGGSGGAENWNPSTVPSSPNSSVDRFQAQPPAPPKHDLGEQYGFTGFGGNPQTDLEYNQQQQQQQQQYSQQNGQQSGYQTQNQHNPYGNNEAAPPPPPHSNGYAQRTTSQQSKTLSKIPSYGQPPPVQRPAASEKRKSWLMRRFSKD